MGLREAITNSIFGVGSLNSKDFCSLARSSFYLSCWGESENLLKILYTGDAGVFGAMVAAARKGVEDLGGAKPGDKTIMDTLVPPPRKIPKRDRCGLRFQSSA